MSENINIEFTKFGSKVRTIGILAILAFIFSFIDIFIPPVSIITFIIRIIILILILSALGNAKEAAYALNNRDLQEFRTKILVAFLISIIGRLIFIFGIIIYNGGATGAGIALIIIGIIILIISGIIAIQGWSRLKTFFSTNLSLFPPKIGSDAESGAKLLKIGAIFHLTVILTFIGFILDVIGCFKLGSLRKLKGTPDSQPTAQLSQTSAPAPTSAPADTRKFCPNCGSSIKIEEQYCSSCGTEL